MKNKGFFSEYPLLCIEKKYKQAKIIDMKVRCNIAKVSFLILLFVFSANASAGNLPCANNSHLHQDKSIDSTAIPQGDLIDVDKSTVSKSKVKSNTKHLGVFKLLIPNTLR